MPPTNYNFIKALTYLTRELYRITDERDSSQRAYNESELENTSLKKQLSEVRLQSNSYKNQRDDVEYQNDSLRRQIEKLNKLQ